MIWVLKRKVSYLRKKMDLVGEGYHHELILREVLAIEGSILALSMLTLDQAHDVRMKTRDIAEQMRKKPPVETVCT